MQNVKGSLKIREPFTFLILHFALLSVNKLLCFYHLSSPVNFNNI